MDDYRNLYSEETAEILELLLEARVVSFEVKNGICIVGEECDRAFGVRLDKAGMNDLAKAIQEVADSLP